MSTTNKRNVVAGLVLGMGMGALEMTIVSTAMPTVIGELGGLDHYAWVFTAYALTNTVATLLWGKLADLYGRKRVFLTALTVFLVGSIASGLASSMGLLIAFRALQGVGAGGIQPVALTLVGDLFDVAQRSRMQGLFGAIWGASGLAGPWLGGLIVTHLSWHWVFFLNVPLGLLSFALVARNLHEAPATRHAALDWAGAGLLVAAVTLLLAGAQAQPTLMGLGLLASLAFVAVEQRAADPLLSLGLLGRPVMRIAASLGALMGGGMMALTTFLPLHVQAVMGGSATEAGAVIAPTVIGWPVASTIAGQLLPKVGFRFLVRFGMTLAGLSTFAFAIAIEHGASLGTYQLLSACFGAGLGCGNTPLLIAVQSTVAHEERGVATAAAMFFRFIGGTLFVGLLGAALASSLAEAPGLTPELAARLLSPERSQLPAAVLADASAAITHAVVVVFRTVAAAGAGCIALGFAFPNVRSEGGMATVASAE